MVLGFMAVLLWHIMQRERKKIRFVTSSCLLLLILSMLLVNIHEFTIHRAIPKSCCSLLQQLRKRKLSLRCILPQKPLTDPSALATTAGYPDADSHLLLAAIADDSLDRTPHILCPCVSLCILAECSDWLLLVPISGPQR
jgi:hypothetical protein